MKSTLLKWQQIGFLEVRSCPFREYQDALLHGFLVSVSSGSRKKITSVFLIPLANVFKVSTVAEPFLRSTYITPTEDPRVKKLNQQTLEASMLWFWGELMLTEPSQYRDKLQNPFCRKSTVLWDECAEE